MLTIALTAILTEEVLLLVLNYASKNDMVPYGELVVASSLNTNEYKDSRLLGMALKDREELVLLEPSSDEVGMGHNFQNPTFSDKIDGIIKDYIKKNGEYE